MPKKRAKEEEDIWHLSIETEDGTLECTYNLAPARLYFMRFFAGVLEQPDGVSRQSARAFLTCVVHAQRVLHGLIKKELEDAMEFAVHEASAQTMRELDGKVFRLNPEFGSEKMIEKVAREARKRFRQRVNAPAAGRPLEKEAFLEDVRESIRRLRKKEKAITQESVAEVMGCDARALRERQKNYEMTWKEVLRECS
jgi:hypothetical protein